MSSQIQKFIESRQDIAGLFAREIASKSIQELEDDLDWLMSDEATKAFESRQGEEWPCPRETKLIGLMAIRLRVQPLLNHRLKTRRKPSGCLQRILEKLVRNLEAMGVGSAPNDPSMPPTLVCTSTEALTEATPFFRELVADKPRNRRPSTPVVMSAGLGSRLARRKASG